MLGSLRDAEQLLTALVETLGLRLGLLQSFRPFSGQLCAATVTIPHTDPPSTPLPVGSPPLCPSPCPCLQATGGVAVAP